MKREAREGYRDKGIVRVREERKRDTQRKRHTLRVG